MKKDADLKRDVINELKWESRVNETEIGVSVTDGVITLTGTVGSWATKVAAEEAAHRVGGVLDVANDIDVKPVGSHVRTDTEIARAVRSALEWDVFIPDECIRSTVSQGWVTLEGDVEVYNHRADAERAVRNLTGVRGVVNRIEVAAARVNAHDIRDALNSGAVHSAAERQAVVGAARATPGVQGVVDQLRVEP